MTRMYPSSLGLGTPKRTPDVGVKTLSFEPRLAGSVICSRLGAGQTVLDEHGIPHAVGTEEPVDLARLDNKTQIVHGVHIPVGLR